MAKDTSGSDFYTPKEKGSYQCHGCLDIIKAEDTKINKYSKLAWCPKCYKGLIHSRVASNESMHWLGLDRN